MPRPFDLKSVLSPLANILRKLNKRRDYLREELQMVESEIARLGGRSRRKLHVNAESGNGVTAPKHKRVRRSREDLEAAAQKIIDFIGTKGKQGASGGEIKAVFGNLLPSVNAWLKNYSRAKFKTTGAKSKTRHFV